MSTTGRNVFPVGGSIITVKRAVIDDTGGGDTTVVAAVSGKRIRVLGLAFAVGAADNVTFKSGSTALSGAIELLADSPYILPFTRFGWMETATGEALVFTVGATAGIDGHISYAEVN